MPGRSTHEKQLSDRELELSKVYRRKLENWREVLYYINSVLEWDKSFYPGIIAFSVTTIFVLIWYFDPSVLTTTSIIAIVICILDYGVPALSSSFFDPNKWTGAKEKKFQDICDNLAHAKFTLKSVWMSVNEYKIKSPKIYFIGIVIFLVFLAWIGNAVNNLFLSYLLSMTFCFSPGIVNHQLFKRYAAQLQNLVAKKNN